jgi:tetratricopeptide (TPR) repeat protein
LKKKRSSRTPGAGAPPGMPGAGSPAAPAPPPGTADRPAGRPRLAIGAALALLAVAIAGWWIASGPRGSVAPVSADANGRPSAPATATATATLARVPAAPPPAWVDEASCAGCHADAARAWRGSHHARAMAAPSPETVRGAFDGREFRHAGVTTRFFRRDDRYLVRTDGPDGRPAEFEVRYAFGWAPLQQYLLELPGGRLQPLQVAWDEPKRRWFHLLPDEKAPPGDVLHWTGRYQNANTMCISCHTTGFEKRYDAATDTFASTWHAPNVGCQSCHGPGERHVGWARSKSEGRAVADLPGERLGLVVDFRALGGRGQVEVCAACHSRRTELTATPTPGAPRLDHYLPALLRQGLYHADGQQLDEVFVDGSYRQSRMHRMGVACTDCHAPHDATLKRPGNATCTQCHAPQAEARFPSAAGPYDTPAHHHHREGSAGAQCVACHMPAKTYMRIQPRPDHSMRVPRPDLTVSIGTPNACTQCHADRPAQWAADAVARWYGPDRRREPHFGEAFAAARAGRPGAAVAVAAIAADAAQPGIVRATALELLRGEPRVGDRVRIEATRDPDPEVRAAAADSLEALSPDARVQGLGPLLADPLRAVRIAAARGLSTLPRERIDASLRPALDAALAEYVAVQQVSLDMPGARLNLAVVAQAAGRLDDAERQYLAALRIDPDFTPARANLSRLYNESGRNADAERVLAEGLARQPGIGELQYSLGLLLAEEGRMPEAAKALARAAALLPERARVHYNLGLALQRTGQRVPAEAALLRAQQLAPEDAQTTYALAVLYAQDGRWEPALRWGERLLVLSPGDPGAARFVEQLRARR